MPKGQVQWQHAIKRRHEIFASFSWFTVTRRGVWFPFSTISIILGKEFQSDSPELEDMQKNRVEFHSNFVSLAKGLLMEEWIPFLSQEPSNPWIYKSTSQFGVYRMFASHWEFFNYKFEPIPSDYREIRECATITTNDAPYDDATRGLRIQFDGIMWLPSRAQEWGNGGKRDIKNENPK